MLNHRDATVPWTVLSLAVLACSSPTKEDPSQASERTDTSATEPTDTESDPPVDTSATDTATADTHSDTADSGNIKPPPEYDCSSLPAPPFEEVQLEAPRGYNDVVFDVEGAMIGSNEPVFIRATSPDDFTVYAPVSAGVYKVDLLADGDIVTVGPVP